MIPTTKEASDSALELGLDFSVISMFSSVAGWFAERFQITFLLAKILFYVCESVGEILAVFGSFNYLVVIEKGFSQI